MSFESEFLEESENVIKATKEAIKVATITLFSGVITTSPVGNPSLWKSPAPRGYVGGAFRANWYLTHEQPSDKFDADARNVLNVASEIGNSFYDSYILTNNSPYSERLESGQWSTQAPNGIVAPNESKFDSNLKAASDIANKKYGVK